MVGTAGGVQECCGWGLMSFGVNRHGGKVILEGKVGGGVRQRQALNATPAVQWQPHSGDTCVS